MDERTIDAYNKLGLKYDEETEDFWQRLPRTFLDKFIELARRDVLDVGSGPGRDGIIIQASGLTVTCLDASEAMVRLSSERGLKSVLGDFDHLPFADEEFDAVWAYTSLLHVPKSQVSQALREIWRVIKPDGILGLGMIEGTIEEYRETEKVPLTRWFSFYTTQEIEELLRQHHFAVVYFEVFKPRTKNYLNFIAKKFAPQSQ